jgi:excisionase family DNA binding protein
MADDRSNKPEESDLREIRAALSAMAEQLRLLRLPLSPLLSVEEAAETLGVSRKTIDRLIADGRLPVVSIESGRGDQRIKRVQASDLQSFIDARRHPAGRGTSRQHRRQVQSKPIRVPDVRLD